MSEDKILTVQKTKKIDAGWKDKAKIDITGYEVVRSDVSQYARDVQEEVLSKIVYGADKREILKFIKRKRDAVKNGEVDLERIGIPSGIGKKLDEYESPTPHVRGSIYANKYFDANIQNGDKVKMLWLKGNKSSVEYETGENVKTLGLGKDRDKVNQIDCIAFQEPHEIDWDQIEVDWDKMAEKCINGRLRRIIKALGWDMSEIEGQRKLGDAL